MTRVVRMLASPVYRPTRVHCMTTSPSCACSHGNWRVQSCMHWRVHSCILSYPILSWFILLCPILSCDSCRYALNIFFTSRTQHIIKHNSNVMSIHTFHTCPSHITAQYITRNSFFCRLTRVLRMLASPVYRLTRVHCMTTSPSCAYSHGNWRVHSCTHWRLHSCILSYYILHWRVHSCMSLTRALMYAWNTLIYHENNRW